jgi:outer membrane protein assembly factor BamB
LIVQNGQIQIFLGNAIAVLRAHDGSQIWQRPVANVTDGESWVQPEVVADGTVYTAAETGRNPQQNADAARGNNVE